VAHYSLRTLPDAITIPAAGAQRETIVKAIEDATLDEVAFALLAMEMEFNAVGDRMHALRKLYSLARQAGALGSERAAQVVVSALPIASD
jgi:hypothetical protein